MIDRVRTAERLAIAEEVASVLRHDLRNRIATVRSAAFYVKRRVRDTEVWRADANIDTFFGIINEELDAANTMISERVTFRDRFAKGVAPTSVWDCVALAIQIAAPPPSIAVSLKLEGAPTLPVDAAEIVLLVRSLVENAVEASGDSGTVRVCGEVAEKVVALVVADDGAGFTEDQITSGMPPFTTTKPGHAGVGLAIARRIAARYGGTLSLGGPGPGARVRLELPLEGTP